MAVTYGVDFEGMFGEDDAYFTIGDEVIATAVDDK